MTAIIRTHSWRLTPLGAPENWPPALKTAVDIALQSRQPAFVCWGKALTTLYNDAAIAELGTRHPAALGRPYAEIWADRWDDFAGVVDAVLAGEPQHVVMQRSRPSGGEPLTWHTFSWLPLRDDKGQIAGFLCQATESNLSLGDEQLRMVVDSASDAISLFDLTTRKYIYLNPACSALTGFTRDEIIKMPVDEVIARIHPDDLDQPGVAPGAPFPPASQIEYRWQTKSGEYRWLSVRRQTVPDAQGNPVAVVSINRDITASKQAEEALRDSEERLALAMESGEMGAWEWDVVNNKAVWNPKLFELFGLPKESEAGYDAFFKIVHPDDYQALEDSLRAVLADGTHWKAEFRVIHTGGIIRWLVVRGKLERTLDGKPSIMFGVNYDITEQKRAEDELRASQTRLALAMQSAQMGHWEWDIAGDKALRSPEIYEMLGEPPIVGLDAQDTFMRHVHPDDVAIVSETVGEVLKTGRDWKAEFRIIRTDGEERWLAGLGRLVRDYNGRPITMFGVNYDITEQKRAEAELKTSETRYRLLHENLRDGFVETDMEGRFIACNDIYCDMVGYSREELYGLTYQELTPERWHAAEQIIVDQEILVRGYSSVYEKEYRRKDGAIINVEIRAVLTRDDNGTPAAMWALVRDITERKEDDARLQALKEQLMHVGRVNELSQVSAGIAHELNQPLAAMHNYAATARRLIDRGDQNSINAAQHAIAKAGEQAARAGEIVRRMRDFVEKRDTNQKRDDINAIIQEAADLGLIGAKAEGIETHFCLASNLPAVIADRVQIEQVLVNLLHNAMDAMADVPKRVLTLSSWLNGTMVEVIVSDTGHGIPEPVLDRLFHPFVTTKANGMGIGLAISKSIMEAHGGDITAEPRQGGGTLFRLRLPAAPSL
ncbi:hypothetical protein GCM10008941_07410 [Rhizomicrobium palustre]